MRQRYTAWFIITFFPFIINFRPPVRRTKKCFSNKKYYYFYHPSPGKGTRNKSFFSKGFISFKKILFFYQLSPGEGTRKGSFRAHKCFRKGKHLFLFPFIINFLAPVHVPKIYFPSKNNIKIFF